ncbi:hypothetical protein [Actinocorallia populi]|uniref:hypothetical protein n=1 Tax=Actinocorallia populi TaxID=2079200 RepID=UPI000D087290|nr:hypothetical protein [Actinocorallia populi]
MRTGAATLVLGVVLMSTASSAQAVPRAPGAELAVHVTVLSGEPRRGAPVEAQAWVSAPGATAENVVLFLAAGSRGEVRVSGGCAPAVPGHCRLGEVDSAGTTVPFTVEVPSGEAPLTLGLGAFAWADGMWPAGDHTRITFAPAVPGSTPSPSPAASEPPPPPAAPVAASPAPTDLLGLPQVPAQTPARTPPQAFPADGAGPAGRPAAPQPGASTTLVVAEEPGAGQSIRLGVLLAACVLASALALRRGARIRRRSGGGRGPDVRTW